MKIENVTDYDFLSVEGRARFIAEMDSKIYNGITSDGEPVYIVQDKGAGMIMKVIREERPNTFECIEYNEGGYQCGNFYETVEKKDGPTINKINPRMTMVYLRTPSDELEEKELIRLVLKEYNLGDVSDDLISAMCEVYRCGFLRGEEYGKNDKPE